MANLSNPLVSIIINNYNYEEFLKEAIDSAIAQTYTPTEIIVVDDGSTDNSREIIANYADKIIPIFKENGGQASAFNAGFAASCGEVIFFLDADDLFMPTKVAEVITKFEKYPQIGWLFHPQKLVNTELNKIEGPDIPLGKSQIYDFRANISRGKLDRYLPNFGLAATSGFSFRRSLLERILPMPEMIRITSDDYIKFASLGLSPGFAIAKELSMQRIHGKNLYTLRKDKQQMRAKTNILTAFWLKTNFPSLSKYANNTFALGLSMYQNPEIESYDCSEIINQYFFFLSWREKLEINLKTFYYWARL